MTLTQSNDLQHRVNYGVLFRHTSKMDNAQQHWRHTYQLVMPKAEDITVTVVPPFCSMFNHSSACPEFATTFDAITQMRMEMMESVQKVNAQIKQLVPENPKPIPKGQRTSRAILPIIAEISKSLFGFATENDVNILESHIKSMTQDTAKLAKAFEYQTSNLSSFMTNTDKRISNLVQGIKTNNNLIVLISSNVRHSVEELSKTWATLIQVFASEIHTKFVIQKFLDDTLIGIHDLLNNQLSPYLVPATSLLKTLQNISQELQQHYPLFHISNTHPAYYYRAHSVIYNRHNNSLFISIRIPLTSSSPLFDIYQIITFPIPINHTSDHATIIKDLPHYLAISSDHTKFLEFSLSYLQSCVGTRVLHCPMFLPEKLVENPSCAVALFLNDKSLIQNVCIFHFIEHGIFLFGLEISPGNILLSNVSTIVMSCPAKPLETKTGCTMCTVILPCHCTMQADTLHIPPRLGKCSHNNSQSITKSFPINLAFLHSFFSADQLAIIQSNTTLPEPLSVQIPDFVLYKHNLSDIVSSDDKSHLDLNKIVAQIKQQKKIFTTVSDHILNQNTNWLDHSSSFWNQNTLTIASMITSVLSGVTVVYLVYKVRTLTVAIAMVIKAPPTASFPTSQDINLIWHPSTVKPVSKLPEQNTCILDGTSISYMYLHISSLLITAVFIAILVFLLHRLRQSAKTLLTLEITDGKSCVQIPILTLPHCPKFWTISASAYMDKLAVNFINFRYTLNIEWKQLKIQNIHSKQEFSPSEVMTINVITAWKLKNILANEFYTYLYFGHAGMIQYVHIHIFPETDNQTSGGLQTTALDPTVLYPKLPDNC
jgi:hypothetical protein